MPAVLLLMALAGILVSCSASQALKRPFLSGDDDVIAVAFYPQTGTSQAGDLPRTHGECRDFLKRPLAGASDSLVAAVCSLNLAEYVRADSLSRTQDACIRRVVLYDIQVESGLEKAERFHQLQSMLECSQEPRYTRMIQARGKLAHYE